MQGTMILGLVYGYSDCVAGQFYYRDNKAVKSKPYGDIQPRIIGYTNGPKGGEYHLVRVPALDSLWSQGVFGGQLASAGWFVTDVDKVEKQLRDVMPGLCGY